MGLDPILAPVERGRGPDGRDDRSGGLFAGFALKAAGCAAILAARMKPEVQLVYDGRSVQIPSQCGEPAPGQMLGTPAEQLAELAGRECYDSLGNGRDSQAFHRHILEVGHFSVYEHCNFTACLPGIAFEPEALLDLMNRPGMWFRCRGSDLLVTFNLRCILDWTKWVPPHRREPTNCPMPLLLLARDFAPTLIGASGLLGVPHGDALANATVEHVAPSDNEERWVTLRMTGSRGFSHELVRHGDRTAISQRSTRYVDESASPWCIHPLIRAAFGVDDVAHVGAFVDSSRALYDHTIAKCEPYLLAKGVDKGTARKQSRGAARGWLGNALGTSLIFSASVAQWRRMLALRCHPAADAEIRESAVAVIEALRASCYFREFEDMVLVPSPDGLGEVLADGFKA
jgi:thymidylate synthase ThyX